jgi:hypothetical protein
MPLVPLMFWSMSGVVILLWNWLLSALSRLVAQKFPFGRFPGLGAELPLARNGNTSLVVAIRERRRVITSQGLVFGTLDGRTWAGAR